ncbi:MAG TPA: transcriptional repressor [Candidatus Deferrimicrobiaceae bacterium]|jgi:Fur family ferric uptake transcriptional regulator
MKMKFIFNMETSPFPLERLLRRIDEEIAAAGGKRSKSRARIMEIFFRSGPHLTVEELARKVRARHRDIGPATVYRTLKLLSRLGYAKELDFGEGVKRYESSLSAHHDHLVCTECGKVSEFKEPRIESLQEEVARQHGFSPTMHRLSIYGYCPSCMPGEREEPGG